MCLLGALPTRFSLLPQNLKALFKLQGLKETAEILEHQGKDPNLTKKSKIIPAIFCLLTSIH